MKKLLALTLAVFTLILSSCTGTQTEKETNESTDALTDIEISSGEAAKEHVLVENGKTDYVVVYNSKDDNGRRFKDDFCDFMQLTFGVSFTARSDSGSYDKEIIIGEAAREATLSVKAQMNTEEDFAACKVDDDLVLYATDAAQYARLLIALRDYVFADTATDRLVLDENKSFVASLNQNMTFDGSEAIVVKNGVSDYSIVYGADNSESMTYAIYLKQYLKDTLGVSLPILADTGKAEHEIILPGASRGALKSTEARLGSNEAFAICVVDDDVVLAAKDARDTVLGMMKLAELLGGADNEAQVSLCESDSYFHGRSGYGFEYSVKEYCERYQSIYNTYSTYHEDKLYNTSWLPRTAKDDQKLVEALVARMGMSAALMNGSSSVLYDGYVRKLDTSDYSRAAHINGETVKIPLQFAQSYFGKTLTADADGYVDVTAICASDDKYSIYISDDGRLAVITPSDVSPFENSSASDGSYTNAQYTARMLEFFCSSVIPEPGVNTEQTRSVIEYVPYPEYVLDFKTEVYQTTYSPSIVCVTENGSTVYYVSYEINTVIDYEELDTYTVVKKSTDGGNTWATVIESIPALRWASIFENDGTIYLMGSDIFTLDAKIVKLGSDGKYEIATLFKHSAVGGTSPGRVLHANGRIYKAYHVASVSAPENSDLMQASSWTVSNLTNDVTLAPNGAEGSMVQGADGKIYQVMHTNSTQEACVLELSADGRLYTATNVTSGNIVNFPTCISKTGIIYDAKSGKYIGLSNICNTQNSRQRNVLALVVSDDLYTWEIAEYVLVEREMINPLYSTTVHAYQYADFEIDGDDIVMVIREASGYTNTYHDGNYCTFYRLENFRELLS